MTANQLLKRIISGGQTGIDQIGLEVAKSLGIPTGGTAPKGYRTEDGPNEALREFCLTEHTSPKYAARTRINIVQSDGTVLFGEQTSSGTKLTLEACINLGKPYIINPTADQLRQWLLDNHIAILNVAGNRGSKLTSEQLDEYRQILIEALQSRLVHKEGLSLAML